MISWIDEALRLRKGREEGRTAQIKLEYDTLVAEKAGDYMSLTLTDPVTLAARNPVEKAKQQHNILTKQKPLLQIRIRLEMLTERLLAQTLINKVVYCVTVDVWACTAGYRY